eukprot:CAMPEP_0202455938 /NCGR_PEP_ID=MMETSP1360-20130828/13336_1 /ASSEMBLY_ACC=CAM_ASM_000848 /TAXON_ID=515479 /ORGANISM="Licmophora paradoxa, Strain CCMP2313" /LENGTH=87 /DNA_ID=CAMNT_0049075633 /DNA_START=275 /DNA_END=538 /DNA_ORIENTATION=-
MTTNELLDLENNVVVEILTDEEITQLEKWWRQSINFSLRFAVDVDGSVSFSTPPCRGCDPTGRDSKVSIKNRKRTSNARVSTHHLEY